MIEKRILAGRNTMASEYVIFFIVKLNGYSLVKVAS